MATERGFDDDGGEGDADVLKWRGGVGRLWWRREVDCRFIEEELGVGRVGIEDMGVDKEG